MGQITIAGTLMGGPVSPGSGFPQAIFTTQIALTPGSKPFSSATGVMQRRIAVASPSFVALSGIGADDTVTRGDLLYLRSDAQISLRLSQIDPLNPGGAALVRLLNVGGLVLIEFPSSSQLVLLEAQGSATIEYAVTGQ